MRERRTRKIHPSGKSSKGEEEKEKEKVKKVMGIIEHDKNEVDKEKKTIESKKDLNRERKIDKNQDSHQI